AQPLRTLHAGDTRQIEREGTSLAEFARHDHFTAGLFGESEDLRQAEPGALPDVLGGKERFEDASELLARNSDAGILNRHRNEALGTLEVLGRAGDIRHRVDGNGEASLAV